MKKVSSLSNSISSVSSLIFFLVLSFAVFANAQDMLTPEEARAIAEEAYIFVYPMLENYKTMYMEAIDEKGSMLKKYKMMSAQEIEGKGSRSVTQFNQFLHYNQPLGREFTELVLPPNDLNFSLSWLDLRSEPIVLSLPAVPDKRYYSFQLVDMYTHNFAYVGSRSMGFDAGHFLIVGPDWSGNKPKGINKAFWSESQFVFIIGRIQVSGEQDKSNVKRFQRACKLTPLSKFLGKGVVEPMPNVDFPPYRPKKAKSAEFISYVNFLLNYVKVHTSELSLFENFARIGIGVNQPFDSAKLHPEIREAIDKGVSLAFEKIEVESLRIFSRDRWNIPPRVYGDRDLHGIKYLARSAGVLMGIYGDSLEEAYYSDVYVDAGGNKLDGSKYQYQIRLEKDQMPPVQAFWSISMYRLPQKRLAPNPINRYTIGDCTEGLKYGKDGSLTIYLQHNNPGKEKKSNWLPAPNDPFMLVMRLYMPKPEVLKELYIPPPVWKVNPVSYFEHPMSILAIFFSILIVLFGLSGKSGFSRFFKYIPPIVFAYFLPAILTTLGVIPQKSLLYSWIKTYLLPISLFLFTISLDLPTIIRLGWRVIAIMLIGTVGVFVGGPITLAIFGSWLPLPDDAWKGMAALAGSWIGGGVNLVAIGQKVGASDPVLGAIIVADVFCSKLWLGILIFLSVKRNSINNWLRADRKPIDDVQARIKKYHTSETGGTQHRDRDLIILIGAAFIFTWLSIWLSKILPTVGDFITESAWKLLAITTFALVLSFTSFRKYEKIGASKFGSFSLYLLITAIGAQADFTALVRYPAFIVMALFWLLIHIFIVFTSAYLLKAPLFFCAVGSQANIGGAPSASIIASAFHPSLAPVGALLGILGYVLGTYVGLICAYFLELFA